MDIKKHITALGFVPKNGTKGIYHKIYFLWILLWQKNYLVRMVRFCHI